MRPGITLAIGAVTALAAAGCSGSRGHTAASTSTSPPTGVASSAAPTPSPTQSQLTPGGQLTGSGGEVVTVGNQVWAQLDSNLDRIDPHTGTVVASVDVGGYPRAGTTVVGPDVWDATDSGTVVVDTRTRRVIHRFKDGVTPDGSVGWAIEGSHVLRLDLNTGKVTGHASIGAVGPNDWSPLLAAGDGAAWVGLGSRHEVVRIDAATMKRTIITGFAKADSLLVVGVGYGRVWAQQNAAGSGKLYVIDPATSRIVSSVGLGKPDEAGTYGGTNLVFSRHAVWTGDSSRTMTEVSADGKVTRVIQLGADPQYIGVAAGSLWIGVDSESSPSASGLFRVRCPSTC